MNKEILDELVLKYTQKILNDFCDYPEYSLGAFISVLSFTILNNIKGGYEKNLLTFINAMDLLNNQIKLKMQ